MKVSNEFKIGVIAVVSIALLVLGFNFLKGKKLFKKSTTLYALYLDVQGLQNSNPVIINGLQVGSVYKINVSKDMKRIAVELNITKDINIPANSIALIKGNPIGAPSIQIELGDSKEILASGDTVITEVSGNMFNDLLKKVDPVLYQVTKAVTKIDSVLGKFNTILDPDAQQNLGTSIENITRITASLAYSSASLQELLNANTGALAKSLQNVNVITSNLASNNEKINSVVTNLDKATAKLAAINLQKTIDSLDATVNAMKDIVYKLNKPDGTLGKLLNDPTLYQNLASTGNKLNLLIDDIRLHPKRYVSISVFGKKSVNPPLKVPTPDTLNSPYYIETLNGPIIQR